MAQVGGGLTAPLPQPRILLVLGAPGLGTVLQVGPHEGRAEGTVPSLPRCHPSVGAAQDAVGLPGWHLAVLNLIRFSWSHCWSLPRPPWVPSLPPVVPAVPPSSVPSAHSIPSSTSLIQTWQSTGPKMDPWGDTAHHQPAPGHGAKCFSGPSGRHVLPSQRSLSAGTRTAAAGSTAGTVAPSRCCAPAPTTTPWRKCLNSQAPFPCGLVKARRALEAAPLERSRSGAGAGQQAQREGGAAGENETRKDASEQSTTLEDDAGQHEVGADSFSWNESLVPSGARQRAAAAGQEDGGPDLEPPESPAQQNETAPAAARQEEMAADTPRQNQAEQSTGQPRAGAVPHVQAGPDAGSVPAAPQHPQLNASAAPEHNGSRITGGAFCQRGQCPWQVLIRNSRDVGFCGGSLLSSRWVLTAAHCLDLVRPHHVTIGDFDKYQRELKEQKIGVERSWTHPHYDSINYNGDIALLYLSSDVIFNEYSLPICLPSPNLAALLSEEGVTGMVSGWGATHSRGSTLRFLMRVRLPIVSMDTCRQATDRLITDNMFCAGYGTEAADACKGDSGGSFAVSYHNTWFLLGIVSWGDGCAERGKYGVYTRVANYISWIKETVESVADSEKFSIDFS